MTTRNVASQRSTPHHFSDWLCLLRWFAMGIITFQHSASVLGRDELTQLHTLTIGQYGVSIFCVLSGFFALQDSRPPLQWLQRRLVKIFPAYWLVMVLSFFLAWQSGYETFDGYQVVSQMLGLGFFTHGWELVNVSLWFISLLLLCYGFVFLARCTPRPALVMGVIMVLAILAVGFRIEISLARHVIAFSCASLLHRRHPLWLLGGIIPLLLLLPVSSQYACSAAALFLFMIALLLPSFQQKSIQRVTGYIYEYYLVHGIFITGAVYFAPRHPGLAIFAGISSACATAWGLKHGVMWIEKRYKKERIVV